MVCVSKFATVAAASALVMLSLTGSVTAERWDTVGSCQSAIEGIGTGRGVFGLGTSRARIAARADWENAVARAYGPRYARISYAQDVTWDCKRPALQQAKCVLVAKPCTSRTRG